MFETCWTPAARAALLASTGEGQLTRVFAHDPRALRLRVSPYAVRLLLDPESGVLTVGWIFLAL